jgi:hypothetical protein
MVLTLPARSSFHIIARHTRLGGGFGFVLPLKARVGRTCEALALYYLPQILKTGGSIFCIEGDDESFLPCGR